MPSSNTWASGLITNDQSAILKKTQHTMQWLCLAMVDAWHRTASATEKALGSSPCWPNWTAQLQSVQTWFDAPPALAELAQE
jgi:hypothetical protein